MSFETRRWFRRQYLTQFQAKRRVALKAAGGRRVEVTLRGPALDNYLLICRHFGNRSHQRVLLKALEVTAGAIIFSKQRG